MKQEDYDAKEVLFKFLLQKQGDMGEFLLGLVGTLWGLWVINPFSSTFSLSSYSMFLESGVPEWIWGAFFVVLGLTTICGVASKLYRVRFIALFTNMLAWIFVATLFIFSAPSNTAFPVYMVISMLSVWLYVRLIVFHKLWEAYEVYIREFFQQQE